jgi:tetratricopeptide (TPR) repeat protein
MRARSRIPMTVVSTAACVILGACAWSPDRPFDREAPQVNEALGALEAGDARSATDKLEDYLSTGPCAEGNIGAPELVHKRPDGTFDLGLSLFKVGEAFGRRFGEEELDSGLNEKTHAERGEQIACASRVVSAIASDDTVPLELRARAHYLEGNLNFLDGQYEAAVKSYDKALALIPGQADGGDSVGRDAAWNRAIALTRIEDKKDAGQDAAKDAQNEGGNDSGSDSGGDSGKDSGGDSGGGEKDSGHDSGGEGGADANQPPPQAPDAGTPPPPRESQDDRILDQLENAPTVQQEAAKKLAKQHARRGMADK